MAGVRRLALAALALLCLVASCTVVNGGLAHRASKRILVVLQDASLRGSHSMFFDSIAGARRGGRDVTTALGRPL